MKQGDGSSKQGDGSSASKTGISTYLMEKEYISNSGNVNIYLKVDFT
jgi:hypothetical protein